MSLHLIIVVFTKRCQKVLSHIMEKYRGKAGMGSNIDRDSQIEIAIVGDVHEQWDEDDGKALRHLGVDLVFCRHPHPIAREHPQR